MVPFLYYYFFDYDTTPFCLELGICAKVQFGPSTFDFIQFHL
jgi:hypothetical protein